MKNTEEILQQIKNLQKEMSEIYDYDQQWVLQGQINALCWVLDISEEKLQNPYLHS